MEASVLRCAVGTIQSVPYGRDTITTAINKSPVAGPVAVHPLGLEGDQQADLRVHGGPDKAVYLYPSEHYPAWRTDRPDDEIPLGMFGENLTTVGLLENDVRIGDLLEIGSVLLAITQPRQPCYKLGLRFGDMQIVPQFLDSGRSGFYCSVVRPGTLQQGDIIKRLESDSAGPTIAEMNRRIRSRYH